jgi:chromosome segregation ATPase
VVRETVALLVELPQRVRATVEDALQSTTELADSVEAIERQLGSIAEVLGSASEDIRELRATGHRQDARVASIEVAIADLGAKVSRIETRVSDLAREVDQATDRLPGEEKGPLAKARQALTGDESG